MELKEIATFLISGIAVTVSIVTFVMNYRNVRRSRKPVLIFEYEGEVGWAVRNIGNGPALNVLVAQRVDGRWFNPVRIPPMSKDGSFVLQWLGHVNTTGLGATYTDTEDLAYTSICGNDLNQVSVGRAIGPWPETEIGKHWNQPVYKKPNV